jgi:hypothetical protein
MPTWMDTLRDLLCQMYQDLGGDCKDLQPPPDEPEPPPEWAPVGVVTGMWTAPDPVPPGVTAGTVDALLAHLALPGNVLPSAESADLEAWLTALRGAVGA